MLKKKERLTKEAFDQAFKVGRRHHSPTLQLIVAKSEHFHGAVVVGKKVFSHAVDRNRARRQLYAALYRAQQAGTLPVATYIVIAKPAFKTLTQRERASVLKTMLEHMV